jgi:ribonucleoside-diphosphate reductase alpha chain
MKLSKIFEERKIMSNNKILTLSGTNESDEYIALNAKSKLFSAGKDNFKLDLEAARSYMNNHVIPNTKVFKDIKEKIT